LLQLLPGRHWLSRAGNPLSRGLPLMLELNRALTDSVSHVYWTRHGIHRGPPAADFEAERIEWISLRRRPALIADGRIRAACTVAALLLLYHTGPG
jgi:hypothetical protein